MTLLLEGPLYFAASSRFVRHVKAGHGRRYCVMASMPIIGTSQLRDRVYAVCGARIVGAQWAILASGAPGWLPIVSPICQWCTKGIHPEAIAEVTALIERLTVFPNGGAHDPSGVHGRAYVAACRAHEPRPGTYRIADRPPWPSRVSRALARHRLLLDAAPRDVVKQ